MKILLAPSNVANQSTSAAIGLASLGHEPQIWNYGASPNGFLSIRSVERQWILPLGAT